MIDYSTFPAPHLADGLRRYVEHGIAPGRFLAAVLKNDLEGAVLWADPASLRQLGPIVQWLIRELPMPAWGSEANYLGTIRTGGLLPATLGEEAA